MWCFARFGSICSENNHGGVVLLTKLQTSACNFTKSNFSPWVFFTFSKCYQIAQCVSCLSITSKSRSLERCFLNTFYWVTTRNRIVKSHFKINIKETREYVPASIYLIKINNRNTRKRCEVCLKLTMKIPERG